MWVVHVAAIQTAFLWQTVCIFGLKVNEGALYLFNCLQKSTLNWIELLYLGICLSGWSTILLHGFLQLFWVYMQIIVSYLTYIIEYMFVWQWWYTDWTVFSWCKNKVYLPGISSGKVAKTFFIFVGFSAKFLFREQFLAIVLFVHHHENCLVCISNDF